MTNQPSPAGRWHAVWNITQGRFDSRPYSSERKAEVVMDGRKRRYPSEKFKVIPLDVAGEEVSK